MKMYQRILGLLMTAISSVALYLIVVFPVPSLYTEFFTILFGYLLAMFLPGLLIDLVFGWVGRGLAEDIASKCGGLKYGGYLIGYAERSLIFLAVLIAYFDSALSYASILSFLSVIVAGKAIFRYSSRDTNDRACADWYILGTIMSITMALALTWGIFRFLLIG
ncbi:MAG: hypothetical protein AM326_03235 [Candidatus Thorarchaeota archaeon SMTZ-45]|nr:MAG: hypothetical protein AM326_03235 [Candidatus Thorarchaeota archaeon SMTZ-45]